MTKKTIEKHVDTLYLSYISLESAKYEIEKMIQLHGKDAEIQLEQEAYSDGYELNVYAQVLETDKEYKTRIERELHNKERQEKKDLEEFQRLQAKFGKV